MTNASNTAQTNRLLIILLFIVCAILAVTATLLFSKGTGDIDAAIQAYIEKNPDQVIEALNNGKRLQAERQQEEAVKNIAKKRDELEKDANSPSFGNPDGDVVIVKFSDYNCGFCKRVMPTLTELIKADPKVKVVVKDFPILGPQSVQNSKAALAFHALNKTKYQDFHAAMLKRTPRNEEQIVALASEFGVDKNRLLAKMEDPAINEQLAKNMKLGQEIGVQGTPAFVVNGEYVRGAIGLEDFKRIVKDIRG